MGTNRNGKKYFFIIDVLEYGLRYRCFSESFPPLQITISFPESLFNKIGSRKGIDPVWIGVLYYQSTGVTQQQLITQ